MSLWQQLRRALNQQQGVSVTEIDGQATFDEHQLLALVRAAADLLEHAVDLQWSASSTSSSDEPLSLCAIFLSNSAAYVVAVLASLQLGLAFMPLDPSCPPQCLQQACNEACPTAILWSQAGATCGGHGRPAVTGCPLVELPPLAALLEQQEARERKQGLEGQQVHLSQQLLVQGLRRSEELQQQRQQRCCYVLFTSGSTGHPLGVCGTEAGVLNRCRWMQAACPFQVGDRVAFKTSPCFVDSVWELLGPLLGGATLVAVPQSVARDPAQLLRTLGKQRITHLAAVPTLWRALAFSMRQLPDVAAALKLRLAVSSGEPLPPPLLAELQQLLPSGCLIWNLYGSTEVGADCTLFDCTGWQQPAKLPQQQAQRVPVGQPISGTLVTVLAAPPEPQDAGPDDSIADNASEQVPGSTATSATSRGEQQVLPAGSIGQVAVGGVGLAAGYLCTHPAAAAATQQRFVEVPTSQLERARWAGAAVAAARDLPASFWRQGNMRLFLTGDQGWLDPRGCLHLLDRMDLQIKIGGVRVNLAEVELGLNRHPAVTAAAAKLWQLPAGPVLVAYAELRAAPGLVGGSDALQQWCRQQLPPAAVPQHVLILWQLPRSAAGKVQRSQLPPPLPQAAASEHGGGRGAGGGQPNKQQHADPGDMQAASLPPTASGTVSELVVSRAFAAVLGHADFEATSNLFALGGNSLMAAQIAGAVGGGSVEAVFQHPTVRSLAAFLTSSAATARAGGVEWGLEGSGKEPVAQQQQQQQQTVVIPVRRLSITGNNADRAGEQEAAASILRLAWWAKMQQCVDAAPIFEPAPAAASQDHHHRRHHQQGGRVFACSHGGDVCCYDSSSGQQLWCAQLPDRTDAGLVLCRSATTIQSGSAGREEGRQYVAAGTNGGTLYFLEASSGRVGGSLPAGGGLRAPPACDPWQGLVWQPTHGRQLLVAAPPGQELARLGLPAVVSAAVAFDVEQRLALVCCLNGSLLAIAVGEGSLVPDGGSLVPDGGSVQLHVAWERHGTAPLFVSAAVLGGGRLVAAAVDGSITALGSSDGRCLWRTCVHGAVFAPLLPLPEAAWCQSQVMLVGTQDGQLAALEAGGGQQLAAVDLGGKITGVQHLQVRGAAGEQQKQSVVVCMASGVVMVLDLAGLMAQGSGSGGGVLACLRDAVQLPGDVFAPLAVCVDHAGSIAVGCRDDHLYMLCS